MTDEDVLEWPLCYFQRLFYEKSQKRSFFPVSRFNELGLFLFVRQLGLLSCQTTTTAVSRIVEARRAARCNPLTRTLARVRPCKQMANSDACWRILTSIATLTFIPSVPFSSIQTPWLRTRVRRERTHALVLKSRARVPWFLLACLLVCLFVLWTRDCDAGDGSRAPHRTEESGQRVPPHNARHARGEDPRLAEVQTERREHGRERRQPGTAEHGDRTSVGAVRRRQGWGGLRCCCGFREI